MFCFNSLFCQNHIMFLFLQFYFYDVQLQLAQNSKLYNIFELRKMSIAIFDPFPGPQERGQIKNCQICQKQFGVFLRQHQCKRCFRAVCADCGTAKRNVYKQQFKIKPHRLCNVCKVQSDYIMQFVKQNKLKFGQTSEIGGKWSKKAQKQVKDFNLQKGSKASLQKAGSKLTKQIFNQLWDSYNPSFRQLIGLLTFQSSQDDIYMSAQKVFSQVMQSSVINPSADKIDTVMYIVMFCLCLSNVQKAVKLTIYLLQIKNTFNQNLPQLVSQSKRGTNMQRSSNLTANLGKQVVCQYLKALGMTQAQLKKCNQFITRLFKKFMNCFSINSTITEGSIYVIGRIFQRKKYEQLYFYFALMIQSNKEIIIDNQKANNIDIMILQRSNLQSITQKYKKISTIKGILNQAVQNVKYKKTISDLSSFSIESDKIPTFTTNSQRIQHNTQNTYSQRNEQKKHITVQKLNKVQQNQYNFKKKDLQDSSEDNLSIAKTTSMLGQMGSHKKIHHIQVKNSDRSRYSGDTQSQIQRQPRKTIDLGKKQCQNCKLYRSQINQLTKSIQILKMQLNQKQQEIMKINSLRGPVVFDSFSQKNRDNEDEEDQDGQNNVNYMEKAKYLQQKMFQMQNENYSLQKDVQKGQLEIAAFKSKVQELITTNKMLKNSVQNTHLTQTSYQQSNHSNNANQILQLKQTNQLLKQSLLQKNQQMESLHKKTKILTYQIQQKSSSESKTKELQQKIQKLQSQNSAMMKKIQQLSMLILDEQQMALDQADQNFMLKQILRSHNIKFQGLQIVQTNQHRRTTRDLNLEMSQTRKSNSNISEAKGRSDTSNSNTTNPFDLFKKMA